MTATTSEMNGTPRPAMPIAEDWQAVATDGIATVWEKGVTMVEPAPQPVAPAVDHIALAEAEAIRQRAAAETEALRVESEAKAAAIVAKAEAEAEKLRLANERTEMRLGKERAEYAAHLAETNRKREATERATREDRKADEEQQETEKEQATKVAKSESLWMKAALGFAIACAVVALPVQMAAFYDKDALWLLAAPLMLEGGAWIVLSGAAAAVAGHRPHWHYRTIAWLLAFVAAGINLWHGVHAFDTATAGATAFASLAGPGIWDLHEHGRIRKRDGALSRRERKAMEKAEKKAATEKAAADEVARVAKEAAAKAATEAAKRLETEREKFFPKVWEHAQKLAFNLGETSVTEAVWKRAHRDIEGCDPGDSVDIRHGRKAAERRLESVATGKPVNTLSKTTNAQRPSQVLPPTQRRRYNPPAVSGVRRKGDSPQHVSAARKQASIAAKKARTEEQK